MQLKFTYNLSIWCNQIPASSLHNWNFCSIIRKNLHLPHILENECGADFGEWLIIESGIGKEEEGVLDIGLRDLDALAVAVQRPLWISPGVITSSLSRLAQAEVTARWPRLVVVLKRGRLFPAGGLHPVQPL